MLDRLAHDQSFDFTGELQRWGAFTQQGVDALYQLGFLAMIQGAQISHWKFWRDKISHPKLLHHLLNLFDDMMFMSLTRLNIFETQNLLEFIMFKHGAPYYHIVAIV